MATPHGLSMMALGDYRFGVWNAAYEKLKRQYQWRWEKVARITATDTLQYTGKAPDTIDLDGVLYPVFRGGLGQIDAMRSEASKATPLRLLSSNGENLGNWVIASINETQRTFLPGGIPKNITFTMQLIEYTE